MILKLFCVYDNKASAYLPPFAAVNSLVALRMFGDSASDTNHMFNRHPLDYHLFELGEFDDMTGGVSSLMPVNLGNAGMFSDSIGKVAL
ncbi:MAG: nonstructural protein [Microvirus sp.]|nr:MAG: nonstructural protein [Microvirus sp.]